MRGNRKEKVKEIALERIWRLFELAEGEFAGKPERSKRYVELARRISERNNVSVPAELKRNFCKKCGAYLKQGKNSKLRVTRKYFVLSCLECGKARKLKLK